jgi:hypothetical protein
MTTFEYLAVLFSVVVGLGVTQALKGLLRIVQYRRTMRVYWPTLIWTAAVLQWTIFFWWFSGYSLVRLDEWRMTTLLFVLVYSSALFFLLGLLQPDDMAPDFDMRAHFEDTKGWFFGVFLGVGLLDVADTWLKQLSGTGASEGGFLVLYSSFLGVWILSAAVALRVRSDRVLGGLGVVYLIATLYFSNLYGVGPLLDLR